MPVFGIAFDVLNGNIDVLTGRGFWRDANPKDPIYGLSHVVAVGIAGSRGHERIERTADSAVTRSLNIAKAIAFHGLYVGLTNLQKLIAINGLSFSGESQSETKKRTDQESPHRASISGTTLPNKATLTTRVKAKGVHG